MIDTMIEFLLKAKNNTYAAKAAETVPSRPNSHDLRYEDGGFLYIDTYLGGEKFAGEEAVWKKSVPVWSMNYVGRVITDGFSGDFLKEALMRVPKDKPYRGPEEYCDGEYSYRSEVDGDFEWFHGYEEILRNGVRVYECRFHGGIIK